MELILWINLKYWKNGLRRCSRNRDFFVSPVQDVLEKQSWRILAVGISYDKETKEHACKVEEL